MDCLPPSVVWPHRIHDDYPSVASANSRLVEAVALQVSAQISNGIVNRVDRNFADLTRMRTLAAAWVKLTGVAVTAAEKRVEAAEAASA